jgi:hypothetical protein
MILRVRSTNPAAAVVLTPIIAFGALLHLGSVTVVVAIQFSSCAHLFHKPTSIFLRNLREKVWFEILATTVHPEPELSQDHKTLNQRTHRRLHLQSLPIRLRNVQPRQPELWLTPTALTTFRKANANDSHCVSWIIRNIADRKAFDIAIRLASMIPWFEDGLDVEPLYNLIILLLEECFCYTGEVSPEWRDRAYQTAQAILWIHTCALCKSTELAQRSPLPVIRCNVASLDPDFQHLFGEMYGEFPGSVISGYALNSSTY